MSGLIGLYCSLTLDEQRARRAVIQSEIFDQVTRVTEEKNGLQFEFLFSKQLYEKLEAFIALERDCCGLLSFAISRNKSTINVTIDGPPEAAQMIAQLRKTIEGESL